LLLCQLSLVPRYLYAFLIQSDCLPRDLHSFPTRRSSDLWLDSQHDRLERTEVLAWDGRLDNRADLVVLLTDSLRGNTSNAALARAAYARWGPSGFVHLIGDWSVVIRDHANHTIVLASDFAGVRRLYYTVQT